jgi:prepilin-type N-terminal cleavage/methylation domain-containing protein
MQEYGIIMGGCDMRQNKYINKKNEKGFTLVEVMVAVAILSFGILAVAAMQNAALLGTNKSNSVTEATTVAVDRMERLFAIPFDTLAGYSLDTARGDSDFTNPPLPPNITTVQWVVSTSGLPVELQGSARIIRVTVQSLNMKTPVVLENIRIDLT